jgi:hypothetical protein
MKFSDVPDGSYFVVINISKSMPVLFKNSEIEKTIKSQTGFLQCHKPKDASDFNIAPDEEVQLIKM